MTSKLEQILAQELHARYCTPDCIEDPDEEWKAMASAVTNIIVQHGGGHYHLVRSQGKHGSWTMQHPILERFEGALFFCPFTGLVDEAARQGSFGPGMWRVWMDAPGSIRWKREEP